METEINSLMGLYLRERMKEAAAKATPEQRQSVLRQMEEDDPTPEQRKIMLEAGLCPEDIRKWAVEIFGVEQ